MKTVTIEANQTIFDIAIEYYGTTEAVGELMMNNTNLINDPQALAQQGVDYVANREFHIDIPIIVGSTVKIDTQSPNYKQNITKEITKPITTYGTND